MTSGSVIVALATAWGPKFGGINAFKSEIVKSLGILPTRHYELICVVPGPTTRQLQEELRLRFSMQLISLEAFDFRDYTEDRTDCFRDLASASVAMMPSSPTFRLMDGSLRTMRSQTTRKKT
ncbi:MAG: hypothetical protein ACYC7A_14060 [Thermoanaerobaculia bacterium]